MNEDTVLACSSDKETLGGLDSWGNVGLLSRESEAELGRIVQLGITAETSLSLMEEGRREPETSEQAQCPVSEDTLKVQLHSYIAFIIRWSTTAGILRTCHAHSRESLCKKGRIWLCLFTRF